MQPLYKYRTLQNWKFVLDALLNSRLYAATFEDLNDPMEGLFKYEPSLVNEHILDELYNDKKKLKICSLSRTPTNDLMWSYYADGHSGICLEIEPRGSVVVMPVDYSGIATLSESRGPEFTYTILSREERFWQHEEESRIIMTGTYVRVKVCRVIFGRKIKSDSRALLVDLLSKLQIPNVDRKDL